MSTETKIEWCTHTSSPWHGCQHAVYTDDVGSEHEHPGCGRCYAETMSKRNPKTLGVWGPEGTRVMSVSFHANCRRWNKQAEKAVKRASVFPSICDPFEDWQGAILDSKGNSLYRCETCLSTDTELDRNERRCNSCGRDKSGIGPLTMDHMRRDLFATIDACPMLDFLLLTKRPQNVRRMWPVCAGHPDDIARGGDGQTFSYYRPNVQILTSISDQPTAAVMVPELLKCRDLVPVLGVSAEPLLGPVDLSPWMGCFHSSDDPNQDDHSQCAPTLNWCIIGGESGHGARPCDFDWIRSIIHQCKAAGVACFLKQVGSNPVYRINGVPVSARETYPTIWGPIKDGKGGVESEWPLDLRGHREFPQAMGVTA